MSRTALRPRHALHAAIRPLSAIPLAAAALALGLTACSPTSAPSTSPVELGADTVLLDVRTAQEFAAGHVEGARLIDFAGGKVQDAIPALDPDADYLVYCRSGNRSGQAVALMEQAGFTSVTNLGSVEQASAATGLPIVAE
ncbi:rhodanese-like domain-containing protein [Leucobacter chironomi]|uniref:rhodanese-like domain-containing protein n=1 Tax=Leucobacter chironomi TaxID=491918 RepID=UPI0004230991|nr:rhodanese-like domain-containing protein [Leucobacter chironomi]